MHTTALVPGLRSDDEVPRADPNPFDAERCGLVTDATHFTFLREGKRRDGGNKPADTADSERSRVTVLCALTSGRSPGLSRPVPLLPRVA